MNEADVDWKGESTRRQKREQLKAELEAVTRHYRRARYALSVATTEDKLSAARKEFHDVSIQRTKIRRAFLRS